MIMGIMMRQKSAEVFPVGPEYRRNKVRPSWRYIRGVRVLHYFCHFLFSLACRHHLNVKSLFPNTLIEVEERATDNPDRHRKNINT